MPEIRLPYGDGAIEFRIPEANLTGIDAPQAVAACGDPVAEILRALTHPLDTLAPIASQAVFDAAHGAGN